VTIVEILSIMPPNAPIIIALIVPAIVGCIKVFRVLDELALTLEAKRKSIARDDEMKHAIIGAAKAYTHLAETQANRAQRDTIYPST